MRPDPSPRAHTPLCWPSVFSAQPGEAEMERLEGMDGREAQESAQQRDHLVTGERIL